VTGTAGRRVVAATALLALWLSGATGYAGEITGTALDFELSDGRRFVRLADLAPRVTVINFWRYDCPPCLREMPVLAAQAAGGRTRVLAVALHRPFEDALAPPAVREALGAMQTLYGPSEPRGLLARFGNPHGALPHTVVLDAARRACARRSGEIDAIWLKRAVEHCASAGGGP